MRRLIPLVLALALLAGCAAVDAPPVSAPAPEVEAVPTAAPTPEPMPEPTPAPEPTQAPDEPEYDPDHWKNPVAGPAEGGYEFVSEELGFRFTVPKEISGRVGVVPGINGFEAGGESFTLYYYPEDGSAAHFLTSIAVVSPRSSYFDPDNWYQSSSIGKTVIAAGETALYLKVGQIGGSDMIAEDPDREDYTETSKLLADALDAGFTVDSPSCVPELDAGRMRDAALELESRGGASMSRAQLALLAFDMLEAENKGEGYPLEYTDVDAGSEAAQAIAYLAGYGLVSGCDGEGYRPDEAVTRSEFAELAHKLLFESLPVCYGELLEAPDTPETHPAFSYLNYAWKYGWLAADDEGNFRPDEPITDAEAAWVLRAARMQQLRGAEILPDPGFEVRSYWLSEPFGEGGQALVLCGEGGVFCAFVCLERSEGCVRTLPAATGSDFEPEGGSARLDLGYFTLDLRRVRWNEAVNTLRETPVMPGEVKLPVAALTSRESALRALGEPLGVSEQSGLERWDYGTTLFKFEAEGDALRLISIDSSDARFAPSLRGACLGSPYSDLTGSTPGSGSSQEGLWYKYGGEDGAREEICLGEGGENYILIDDGSCSLRFYIDGADGYTITRIVYEAR